MRCADFWHHHALMMLSQFAFFCLYPIRLLSRQSLARHAGIVLVVVALSVANAQTSTDSSDRVDGAKATIANALNALGGKALWSNVCLVQASGTMKSFRSPSTTEFSWSDSQRNGRWHHGRATSNGKFSSSWDDGALVDAKFKDKDTNISAPTGAASFLPHLPGLALSTLLSDSNVSYRFLRPDSTDQVHIGVYRGPAVLESEWWISKGDNLPIRVAFSSGNSISGSTAGWQTIQYGSFQTSGTIVFPASLTVQLEHSSSDLYSISAITVRSPGSGGQCEQ